MKSLNLKINTKSFVFFALISGYCFAQEGSVVINQDKKIATLIEIKKEINKNESVSDRFIIQIYNGNRSGAETTQKEFNATFSDWKATMAYEPPNFKVWAGNFRTRLEGDKALRKIKIKFPLAFMFKPKK